MTIFATQYDPALKYAGLKDFDCGHQAINRFVRSSLAKQVKQGLSAAYVLLDAADHNRLAGFFTLCNHTLLLDRLSALQLGSMPKTVPCTRLVMLGVDNRYQGQRLGQQLMKEALAITKRSASHIGSFGLYLDADPGALGFYLKLGFGLLEGDQTPAPSPMFIPMSAIA